MKKERISFLQVCLTIVFVTAMLISNVITAKQVLLPGGITMTGAVFIFPITYILSDVFSEVYGYKWSRITCYFAFSMNLFMVIVFSLVIQTPAPSYWTNQEAFATDCFFRMPLQLLRVYMRALCTMALMLMMLLEELILIALLSLKRRWIVQFMKVLGVL